MDGVTHVPHVKSWHKYGHMHGTNLIRFVSFISSSRQWIILYSYIGLERTCIAGLGTCKCSIQERNTLLSLIIDLILVSITTSYKNESPKWPIPVHWLPSPFLSKQHPNSVSVREQHPFPSLRFFRMSHPILPTTIKSFTVTMSHNPTFHSSLLTCSTRTSFFNFKGYLR